LSVEDEGIKTSRDASQFSNPLPLLVSPTVTAEAAVFVLYDTRLEWGTPYYITYAA